MQLLACQLMKGDLLASFGRQVRTLRQARNLSQEELAERARVHRTYVGMIERGEKNITLRNIAKLAGALKVPIHELLNMEKQNGE